ncbi:MAG: O-methyltransferase [Kiritimatiellia bacterium]|jgi:O-methyltransferase
MLSYLPKIEAWREEKASQAQLFKNRYDMYAWINQEMLSGNAIDYLEFGVFKGDSIRKWSEINTNADSRFWGFDTFTGLPEDWDRVINPLAENAFDTGGKPPDIPDVRVQFEKGLFQDSLPDFLFRQSFRSPLVIHNDSDLYSATLYVLTRMNEYFAPGTIVIFDEFSTVFDEFRALEDFCAAYVRSYKVLAATRSRESYYSQVAIQLD